MWEPGTSPATDHDTGEAKMHWPSDSGLTMTRQSTKTPSRHLRGRSP